MDKKYLQTAQEIIDGDLNKANPPYQILASLLETRDQVTGLTSYASSLSSQLANLDARLRAIELQPSATTAPQAQQQQQQPTLVVLPAPAAPPEAPAAPAAPAAPPAQ